MIRFFYGILAVCLIVGNASLAKADTIALGFTSASNIAQNVSFSLGWRFDVITSNVTVTQLGYWNSPGQTWSNDHEVGIYTIGGTLVTSVTVLKTDSLNGDFRYHAVAPVVLTAGSTYVIAGVSGPTDYYGVNTTGRTTAPEIVYQGNRWDYSNSLIFPNSVGTGVTDGYFGPNFQYTIGGIPPNAVPVPAGIVMSSIGVLGLGGFTWLRRRKAKLA